jgi:D-galactarolactone cycloisomerase
MMLSGERTYTLVKITASDGTYGIGEAYGSPSIGTKQQILELKPLLVGKNPVGIDAIYSELGRGANSSAGTRTDGSAHNLARAASGVEMALWDLAGHAPKNFLDKEFCREWAQKMKSDPRA